MTDVASFDGTRLAVFEWGSADDPVVILVHGLGLSTDSWGPVPRLLADAHRVIAYDLRGHAQSGDARSRDYSLEAQARDLDAVLAAVLPEGKKAVVVGNSLGGGVITAHARHCGNKRVAAAVLAGSGASGVTFPGFPARRVPDGVDARLRSAWLKVLRATALIGRRIRSMEEISNRLVRRYAFAADAPKELIDQVREHFLDSRPQALAATALASVSHNGITLAPALDVPTLVLHGAADPEVPDQETRELLSALPQPELVTIAGAGHMLPLTHGDLVAKHIARWVRHVGLDCTTLDQG